MPVFCPQLPTPTFALLPSSKQYQRFPPKHGPTEIQKLQGDFDVKSAQEFQVTCRSLFCGSFVICRESYALDASLDKREMAQLILRVRNNCIVCN